VFYIKNNKFIMIHHLTDHIWIFFGLETPDDKILRTLTPVPEKGSIRGTTRATGHDEDTICRWLDIAGAHCQEITDYFFQELELGQVQIVKYGHI
jgi:hypothetical protein